MKLLTGNTYGRLSVGDVERKEQRIFKGRKQGFVYYYACKCECGNTTTVAMNHLKAGKIVSCGCIRKEASTEGLEAWTRDYRVSKGNAPDIQLTDQNKIDRVLFKPLSSEILRRDNYACVWCNVGSRLNVHHIEKWSDNKDRRFDRTNLVTLCKDCHYKVHNGGRYHTQPQPHMSILLEGYAEEIEAICMRVELT